GQQPQHATVGGGVVDEVLRPEMSRSIRRRRASASAWREPLAAAAADGKPLLAVESLDLLVIHASSFALEQCAQAPVAVARMLRRQLAQPRAQLVVQLRFRPVAATGAVQLQ